MASDGAIVGIALMANAEAMASDGTMVGAEALAGAEQWSGCGVLWRRERVMVRIGSFVSARVLGVVRNPSSVSHSGAF